MLAQAAWLKLVGLSEPPRAATARQRQDGARSPVASDFQTRAFCPRDLLFACTNSCHLWLLIFKAIAICKVVMFDFQTFMYICSVRGICYWHVIPDFQTSTYVYVIREICNLRVIKPYQTTSYIFIYMFNIHILQCKAQQGDL